MEPDNVERNLQSLRRLYRLLETNARNESIPEPYLLDKNTQFLLKRLLDFASQELFVKQSKILATQLSLFPRSNLHSLKPSNLPDSSLAKSSQINASQIKQSGKPRKDGLTQEVSNAIEQIDTQLSALSFVSSDRDDRPRSCKTRSLVTPLSEEGRQNFQDSVSGLRPTSQFVGVVQPLPPLAVRSIGFKKPTQSNRTSQKTPCMKPTLMDQVTETESEDTSGETGSSSGSEWDTQVDSVTESEATSESESDSSYAPQSDDDDSEVSTKTRKMVMGRFKSLKNKIGQVFHHHHHHHHHHHKHHDNNKPSAWKKLQSTFHHKHNEGRRTTSESKGITTHKQHRGGNFHALVKGAIRHRKHSKKQKLNAKKT